MFIDDLNMPKLDAYGTQQPITWLQTLMSRGFFYDRGKDLSARYESRDAILFGCSKNKILFFPSGY
jgi:hypothetical protein